MPLVPSLGRFVRALVLASTLFSLTAVTFDAGTLTSAAHYVRYPCAGILFFITLHQGAATRRNLKDAPRPARTLIRGGWLLVVTSAALAPFAVEPIGALSQVGVFAALMATMHVHVTHRWNRAGTVAADMRVTFWALSLPVVVSLALGFQQPRLSGLFDNPNMLALVAAFAIALGFGVWAQRRTVLVATALVANTAAVLMTETRAALLGIVAAVAFLAVRRWSGRIQPGVVIAGCFAGAGAALLALLHVRIPIPGVITRLADNGADPLNSRGIAWDYALELWSRQPLTGYGFRVGEVAFQQHRHLTVFQRDGVHNSYLQLLIEVGVLGYLPFLVMLAAVVVSALRVTATGIGLGLAALIVVGLTVAVAESYMFGVGQVASWVFWLTCAAAASSAAEPPSDEREAAARLQRRTVASSM